MAMKAFIKKSTFKSSVQLMLVSRELSAMAGITLAAAQMGTVANKNLLMDIGVSAHWLEDVTEQDLIIVIKARDEKTIAKALQYTETLLRSPSTDDKNAVSSLKEAYTNLPGANMVLISLPAEKAVPEAKKALEYGLHVQLFSDNISIEDEVELKGKALSRGLLMMGPDCGSAIINGIPLGFANAVRRGSVGIVSASGTGLQEVSCLVDRFEAGVSQAIGVGGRDLSSAVGGVMTLEAMGALDRDPQTKVVVVISKPPAANVLEKILNQAQGMKKPVVMNLIGSKSVQSLSVKMADTLEAAAVEAVILSGQEMKDHSEEPGFMSNIAESEKTQKNKTQKYIRGLFVGGTLCSEALSLLSSRLERPVYTNINFPGAIRLDDVNTSIEDTCIDLGDDHFTKGRAHPMIDPSVRHMRLIKEGSDPEVALILMDIVLGYGAHKDPAGVIIPVIKDVQKDAKKAGRHITFVVSVLGTDRDPQNRRYTIARLRDAGVMIAESNAHAVKIAQEIICTL